MNCLEKDIVAVCEDRMLLVECELFDVFLNALRNGNN